MNGKKLKKGITLLIVVGLAAAGLAGCANSNDGKKEEPKEQGKKITVSLKLSPEDYPKVDGSTATIPLSEAFASAVMELPIEEARQYVKHNTTHEAYVNLLSGSKDLIFVTSPSSEELEEAKRQGIELEIVPIVSEGFVFLVNKKNPVEDLTLEQIKGIYGGTITNWKQAGGEDKEITAYQRPENSGSQTGMLSLVISPDAIAEPPLEKIPGTMGQLVDAVAQFDEQSDGIGYSYFYYVTDMWKNKDVKLLSVNGVKPSPKTISDGTYPIHTAYYAVLRKDAPEDSVQRKMLEWILSAEGQQIAEEAGYVRLKVDSEK